MLPSFVAGTECEMLNMFSSSLSQTQEVSLINCIAHFSNYKTKARFHVAVRTQINKFVFYFIVRRNVNFGCSEC